MWEEKEWDYNNMYSLIIGFAIGLLICLGTYEFWAIKYRKTTYYKDKKIAYIKILFNKGLYGEYLSYIELKKYEEQGAKFLFNCYLPTDKNRTSEVDVMMIHKSGIYVLESKNYSGWIFGNENDQTWTQTINTGKNVHKEHFYNPIKQNQTHIKWLRTLLKKEIDFETTPFSLIVFSERCTLKNITNTNPLVKVINRYDILKEISAYDEMMGDIISEENIIKIYDILKPYTMVDEVQKQKHIDDINSRYKKDIVEANQINASSVDNKNSITAEIDMKDIENKSAEQVEDNEVMAENREIVGDDLLCPRCGAKLVLRTAKKGNNMGNQFYGCSAFPKCRYTKND